MGTGFSNQVSSLPGSSEQHAQQGYQAISKPNPPQQQSRPTRQLQQGPNTAKRQPSFSKSAYPRHGTGHGRGSNPQNTGQNASGQRFPSSASKSALPSPAENSSTAAGNDVQLSNATTGKSTDFAAGNSSHPGLTDAAKTSNADKVAPAAADHDDSDASVDAFEAAFGLGGGLDGRFWVDGSCARLHLSTVCCRCIRKMAITIHTAVTLVTACLC